jgi:hypothetical protein
MKFTLRYMMFILFTCHFGMCLRLLNCVIQCGLLSQCWHYMSVCEWRLFNTKLVIFIYIMARTSFDMMKIISAVIGDLGINKGWYLSTGLITPHLDLFVIRHGLYIKCLLSFLCKENWGFSGNCSCIVVDYTVYNYCLGFSIH